MGFDSREIESWYTMLEKYPKFALAQISKGYFPFRVNTKWKAISVASDRNFTFSR